MKRKILKSLLIALLVITVIGCSKKLDINVSVKDSTTKAQNNVPDKLRLVSETYDSDNQFRVIKTYVDDSVSYYNRVYVIIDRNGNASITTNSK